MKRYFENFLFWIARRLPRRLVYWCVIRVACERCPDNPAERTCGDALEAWSGVDTFKGAGAMKSRTVVERWFGVRIGLTK
jgi:hypothetical protein